MNEQALLDFDRQHIWHPYASVINPPPVYPVVSASGVRLTLADGRELIDGMSSWWSAIHGYNHPILNKAVTDQLAQMAHVMFGGITHPSAVKLCKLLVDITHPDLDKVFLCDSGSVAVEVAMKMAIQYWYSIGNKQKNRMLTVRSGYHGDTFAAMSVCDPVTGMHHVFNNAVTQQFFADAPATPFGEPLQPDDLSSMRAQLEAHHESIAAVILEPVVQGTGGMRFYSTDYLKGLQALCEEFNVLLIFDEIATGFGRTGKLFAYQHADVCPDILCLGKSITGGYMTLAATLCNTRISDGICQGEAGVFMHGPTFMANPLACATAIASIELLLSQPWQRRIAEIESILKAELSAAKTLDKVADVRVMGAIGVIETREPVQMATFQKQLVDRGIWLRPFGNLVYTMPPFIINDQDLQTLTREMVAALAQ